MKRIIRLTESDLHSIVKYAINESLNTLRLQFINGYFYPTDSISSKILEDEFELGRIPENRLGIISPQLVKRGYKLAISDYDPPKSNYDSDYAGGARIGGVPKPQKNPCTKCGFKGVCDSNDCGKKNFKLFRKY